MVTYSKSVYKITLFKNQGDYRYMLSAYINNIEHIRQIARELQHRIMYNN